MSNNYNRAALVALAAPARADLDQTYLSLGQKLSNLAMMSMLDKKEATPIEDNEML